MTDSPDRPLRYFISYRRHAAADARLATMLEQALAQAGCEVFIDVAMKIGTDWSAEIERRIGWCDFLVVLLSADSIASEMVQGEVRRAHAHSKAVRRNMILPLRVAYEGELGYELDSYLGRLHYALWRGPEDDGRIVAEILRCELPEPAGSAAARGAGPAAVAGQPQAKADMRLLRASLDAPGSPLASDDPFYVRREADQRIDELAGGKPRTLVIKGPSQCGKSSLLRRYLARCLEVDQQVAFIDLGLLGDPSRQSFADYAGPFAELIVEELGLDGVTVPAFARALELTRFVENEILPRTEGPVVLAIDDADRVIGCPWQEDFYSALRNWDAKRARPGNRRGWERLGLALAVATDPRMLIESGYTSPFNVGEQLRLGGFGRDALDAFNRSYRQLLSPAQLDCLFELLGGHPYLTPLAFHRLLADGADFEQLCHHAAEESGPFGDHLRARLERLYAAGLGAAMREVVFRGRVPDKDRRLFYRLEAAGLAREEGGHIVPSLMLYQRFFKAVL